MARNARLALADDQCDLSHGQFHGAQQMDDPHARGVRQSAEKIELAGHENVICSLLYGGQIMGPRLNHFINRIARDCVARNKPIRIALAGLRGGTPSTPSARYYQVRGLPMTKTIALSLVVAASISLAACSKPAEPANNATNAAENTMSAAANTLNAASNNVSNAANTVANAASNAK